MDGQLTFAVVRPPVRIPERYYVKPEGDERWVPNARGILGACKEAALNADWSLRRWVEFSETAVACLADPAAPLSEMDLLMTVVRERFEVS